MERPLLEGGLVGVTTISRTRYMSGESSNRSSCELSASGRRLHERNCLRLLPIGLALEAAELATVGVDQDRGRQDRDVERLHGLAALVEIDAEMAELLVFVKRC